MGSWVDLYSASGGGSEVEILSKDRPYWGYSIVVAISPATVQRVHINTAALWRTVVVKSRQNTIFPVFQAETTYVNLQLNPERYTGYSGPSARRIWDAVYSENCPKYPSEEMCQEERILYKLISGLHSSIPVHIASEYLLEEATNMAAEYLTYADYSTGNPTEDLKAQSLMRELLCNPTLQSACPLPFDEAKLWKGQSGPELKQKIQKQFRSALSFCSMKCACISVDTIMDCVGCEKCRLWGKLQVLGLGTALKILFLVDGKEHPAQPLELQRKELIALMNLLNRLSESVKFVKEMGPKAEAIEGGRKPPLFRVALYTACGPRAE
ncbi:hypothetical protein SAY86_006765 [Trapa natans]|uniref:Endoplasmic reticulum oxidoreductin 1 n=1 Tax=Trapa natans TaxID=22666 RepID=A0AAN7QUJ0_TRANT|nr:hypothetical protein SAY86_006765 [Trapa natans]